MDRSYGDLKIDNHGDLKIEATGTMTSKANTTNCMGGEGVDLENRKCQGLFL